MIGSMSRAAWRAWRSFLLVISPVLWFSTPTAQPRGLTMRGSMSLLVLTRSQVSCFTNMAWWYSPVSTPATRTAVSGTGMNRISSTHAVRLPAKPLGGSVRGA